MLSLVLFILAIDGMHVTLEWAHLVNVFRGYYFGCMEIYHPFYTDDTILLSSWSMENAKKIVRILKCFYLASGLTINLLNSKLIGVGVACKHVEEVVDMMGCQLTSIPFIHLGILVGKNMARVSVCYLLWGISE